VSVPPRAIDLPDALVSLETVRLLRPSASLAHPANSRAVSRTSTWTATGRPAAVVQVNATSTRNETRGDLVADHAQRLARVEFRQTFSPPSATSRSAMPMLSSGTLESGRGGVVRDLHDSLSDGSQFDVEALG
jgi:hypothetical protein